MMMMIIIITLPWGVKNWSSKNIIITVSLMCVKHHVVEPSQLPHLNIRDT